MGATPALLTEPSQLHLVHFDPHGMSGTLQGSQLEHVQLEPGNFQGVVAQVALDALRVDWGGYSLSVLAQGALSPDCVCLGMLVSGVGDWRVMGMPASNGDLLLSPEGGELTVSLPSQSQWLAMQIPRERVEALGIKLSGLQAQGGWYRSGTSLALQRSVAELATRVTRQSSQMQPRLNLVQMHEELFAAVAAAWVAGAQGDSTSADSLSSNERWRVVRRAESYLSGRTDPTVRMDEVCVAAATSLSRLERAFREVYGHGPRRTLTLRRLAAVRRELLLAGPGVLVTEVATRWGFFHLGRFSREYAELYQEQPSTTLRRSQAKFGPVSGRGASKVEVDVLAH